MMAAGGSLEPYWRLYAVHKKGEVRKMLDSMRIGDLSPEDAREAAAIADSDDPYVKEPVHDRQPFFTINSAKPYNAEPPPELLVDGGFITPKELFYVRNHLPVPDIDPEKYTLEVCVEGGEAIHLSLADLKSKFPHYSVTSAIQCAGNGRSDLAKVKAVKGLDWGRAAVANSEWKGVLLRDVLAYAGLKQEKAGGAWAGGIKHVQFEGLDKDMTTCYGSSITVKKAMDPEGDVLLAFEMNGEPLTRDHGFPIRAVVPGVVGARNVVASKEESQNHWQQRDYKGFSPNVDWSNVDFSSAPAIQELPVTSAICSPMPGAVVSPYDQSVTVKGYALAGGGRAVVRVDVSADGGKTWHTAELKPTGQELNRTWAWTLWEHEVPIAEGSKEVGRGVKALARLTLSAPSHLISQVQLVCKAVDAGYNVQPESSGPIWNLRGVLCNSWHAFPLHVEDS
ncbi:unnamed protein product [Chrysoparadoxa australica]